MLEPLRRVGKLLVSLRSTKETHRGIDTSVKKTLEKVNPQSHAIPDRPSVDPPELSQALIARFSNGSALSRSLIPRIQTVCCSLDPSAEQRFLGIGRHDHWKALQILDEIVERRLSVVDQKVGQFFFAITGCLLSDLDLTRLAFAYHCSSSDKQILLDLLYKEVVSKSQIIDDSLSVEIVPAEPDVLFVDVTHTETYPHISGIQRLVRKCCEAFRANGLKHKLIRKVQGLRTFELVDKELTMQMNIASAAPFWHAKLVERLRQRVSRSLRALGILWPIKLYRRLRQLRWPSFKGKTIRVPLLSGGIVLLPEVCADEERPELYLQLKRHFPVTVGMVCYDLIPMVHPEYCALTTFAYYLQTLRVADRISCISEHIRQQFEHFMNLVDRDDHPSRLGVHSLAGDIFPARRGMELPDGIAKKPLILSVGTLEPRKNHVGIMRAAKLLWNRGLEFKLVIAGGKGWQNDRILSEAKDAVRAGYNLQIIFDISEPELARLYEAARFTVFCSFAEGFGLPILESHAFGKPCVTSNIGSMAEIARDGGCLPVDPRSPISIAEGMLQLIENESLYSKLREEIRTKRTRTWNEYAMELYRFLTEPLPRDRCPFG